jgi:hypothetical protein
MLFKAKKVMLKLFDIQISIINDQKWMFVKEEVRFEIFREVPSYAFNLFVKTDWKDEEAISKYESKVNQKPKSFREIVMVMVVNLVRRRKSVRRCKWKKDEKVMSNLNLTVNLPKCLLAMPWVVAHDECLNDRLFITRTTETESLKSLKRTTLFCNLTINNHF